MCRYITNATIITATNGLLVTATAPAVWQTPIRKTSTVSSGAMNGRITNWGVMNVMTSVFGWIFRLFKRTKMPAVMAGIFAAETLGPLCITKDQDELLICSFINSLKSL